MYSASEVSNRVRVEEILEHLWAALLFRQKAQSMLMLHAHCYLLESRKAYVTADAAL